MSRISLISLVGLAVGLGGCSDKTLAVFNAAPIVNIESPTDGTVVEEGTAITFLARVDDANDADEDLEVRWSGNPAGEIPGVFLVESGETAMTTAALEGGVNHVITVYVTDPNGETDSASITITVEDVPDAPEIELVRPIEGETATEGVPFTFEALVSDPKQDVNTLVVRFETDQDEGVFCEPEVDAAGVARCEATLGMGAHVLTYTVDDDEGFSASVTRVFTVLGRDGDGDGFEGESFGGTDCDDTDPSVYPGATETCNGVDEDCDGRVDEDTICSDDDGDGYTEAEGDCDDANPASYPLGPEIEDGYDNNCNGVIDEGTPAYDDDGDGYSERAGDCDDGAAALNPGATETFDGIDNDCDTTVDEANATGCTTYYYDYDGDGFGSSTSSCLCAATGYYTSGYATDCYDYNAAANPAAVGWNTNNRGDGNFDYNCDGSQEKRYNDVLSCGGLTLSGCFANTAGWNGAGSNPACGAGGTYYTDCDWSWGGFSCSSPAGNVARTQECR